MVVTKAAPANTRSCVFFRPGDRFAACINRKNAPRKRTANANGPYLKRTSTEIDCSIVDDPRGKRRAAPEHLPASTVERQPAACKELFGRPPRRGIHPGSKGTIFAAEAL